MDMDTFLPCLYAALASTGFALVFELRRWQHIVAASFAGAMSWLVYLMADDFVGPIGCNFLATVAVALLAEIFARMFKAPATVFLITGIIPLVPGGGLYYTMDALIDGNMALFAEKGIEAAGIAGAIAAGSSLVSSMVRILPKRKRKN
jgi:uncharacterized membrane protein YjjB (DUF3815 family)